MPTIVPSNPTANTPVLLHLEGGGCGVRASAEVEGFMIHYLQTEACLCWSAPPPYSFDVPLGLLPAGEYTLIASYGSYEPEDASCPLTINSTVQSNFVVLGGTAHHPVPALGASAGLTLCLLVLGATMWLNFRRRNSPLRDG